MTPASFGHTIPLRITFSPNGGTLLVSELDPTQQPKGGADPGRRHNEDPNVVSYTDRSIGRFDPSGDDLDPLQFAGGQPAGIKGPGVPAVFVFAPVPEPSCRLLIGLGGLGLVSLGGLRQAT